MLTYCSLRYETMTLVEALNGPISHIQSCVVPTAPLGYNIDSPHEVSTSLNSKVTRRSSRPSIAIQQVTVCFCPSILNLLLLHGQKDLNKTLTIWWTSTVKKSFTGIYMSYWKYISNKSLIFTISGAHVKQPGSKQEGQYCLHRNEISWWIQKCKLVNFQIILK